MPTEITRRSPGGQPPEDTHTLQHGGRKLLDTPAGKIHITAEEGSFVVTRPGSNKPGTRYTEGQSLTIHSQDGSTTKVLAVNQEVEVDDMPG